MKLTTENKLIKILELFGGIGSPRKALERKGINLKSIDYVEVLPHAVAAYNSMFNNDYDPQDIRVWNLNTDILIHGSPCQDWSKNGKNDISTGRSILYERTLEIIKEELHPRPKVVVWENVANLISKRHIEHFNHYLTAMELMGYTNSYKVLNSKNYGMAQNRERIFVVSTLSDKKFEFPKEKELIHNLSHYIDKTVNPDEYALSENELSIFFERDGQLYIRENNSNGEKLVEDGDSINIEFPKSKTRRGRVQKGLVPTITTSPHVALYYDGILRKITPKEAWLLMGYDEDDYLAVADKIPVSAQFKLAGNSIVVQVMEEILGKILVDYFDYDL